VLSRMRLIPVRLSGWQRMALAIAIVVGCLTAVAGSGGRVEDWLRSGRDLVRSQPASGQIHIVEIDARSIAAIARWPWPRGEHARLVDALRAAGARSIAFDVDFSAASHPAEDARFASALSRSPVPVVLPAFRQQASSDSRTVIDSEPFAAFRDHAFLGAVNIMPDSDGYVRKAPFGVITNGSPRPSLAAMVARHGGAAYDDFRIDFAIEPESIPRHSFIDVASGRAASALRGKDVIVGATAIELGDRYAVPGHGVIPGVVIQALAAETLMKGTPAAWSPLAALILAIGLSAVALAMETAVRLGTVAAGSTAALMFVAAIADGFALSLPVVPALATLAIATVLGFIRLRLIDRYERLRIDAATGLPNRLALEGELSDPQRARIAATVIARFDDIAATLGPAGTTQMVQRVAERLALAAGGGRVYRLDERILAWDASQQDLAGLVDALDGLRSVFLAPVEVVGRRIDVVVAFGIADGSESATGVVGAATAAAAHALDRGDRWHIAETGDADSVERDLSLMGELDDALANGAIDVVFQPKLHIASRSVTSAEALVRWNHPKRGPIRPDVFVALAEQSDRIDGLTLYVIRRALAAIAATQTAGSPITVAVNISAKLLSSQRFNAELDVLLDEQRDLIGMLIFEVTESAAMADIDAAVAALRRYRDAGVAVSMDDYGTGQSTLTYIKRLPLSELKIDRSFVQNAHMNIDDGILVQSTIELAHRLRMKVVAEGVEDQACLDYLARIGCDYAQGWLISRPVPLEVLVGEIVTAFREAA